MLFFLEEHHKIKMILLSIIYNQTQLEKIETITNKYIVDIYGYLSMAVLFSSIEATLIEEQQ